MFSNAVVGSDAFLDMPPSTQNLYFQFGMDADDDGFVNPKKTIRMINANDDDFKLLIAKGYLIPFPSGVVCISHWRVNNLVRKDWYRPTIYQKEFRQLSVGKLEPYSLLKQPVNELVNELVNVSNKLTNKQTGDTEAFNRQNEDERVDRNFEKIHQKLNELGIAKKADGGNPDKDPKNLPTIEL